MLSVLFVSHALAQSAPVTETLVYEEGYSVSRYRGEVYSEVSYDLAGRRLSAWSMTAHAAQRARLYYTQAVREAACINAKAAFIDAVDSFAPTFLAAYAEADAAVDVCEDFGAAEWIAEAWRLRVDASTLCQVAGTPASGDDAYMAAVETRWWIDNVYCPTPLTTSASRGNGEVVVD